MSVCLVPGIIAWPLTVCLGTTAAVGCRGCTICGVRGTNAAAFGFNGFPPNALSD